MSSDRDVVDGFRDLVARTGLGSPVGLYLTGSACAGGLRPDSDLDLLLLTRRALDETERRLLLDHLVRCSGRRAQRPGRPVEMVSVVLEDVVPWRHPARRDFQYGEWLRDDYEAGLVPQGVTDPDLAIVLTVARQHSRPLLGPALTELTGPVPDVDLRRAVLESVPGLVADLSGDERNVLLTLARIVVTLRTGRIVAKDVAAAEVTPRLAPGHASLLTTAAAAYRGEVTDDWGELGDEAAALAAALVRLTAMT